MKKILSKWVAMAFLLLVATVPVSGQQTLTVADGTTTNEYVPIYGYYCDVYLRCQYVFPESMLSDMVGGTINSMTFYLSSPATSSLGNANFQVYLTDASSATISSFIDPTTATTVYTGTLDATQSTMTVTFTTPFVYEGGNLLIGFDKNNYTEDYAHAFFYGISSPGSSIEGDDYDAMPTTFTQQNFLPKTTFNYTEGVVACSKPRNLASSNATSFSADLAWDTQESPINFELRYKAENDATYTELGPIGSGTTYTLSGLNSSTRYLWSVKQICNATDQSDWTSDASFRTTCVPLTQLPYVENFEAVDNNTYVGCGNFYAGGSATASLSSTAQNGSYSLYAGVPSGSTLRVVSEPMDLSTYSSSLFELAFYARVTSTSYGALQVGFMSDPSDMSTFTLLKNISPANFTSTNTWQRFTKAFVLNDVLANSTMDLSNLYLAFVLPVGTTTNYVYLDNITMEELTLCHAPYTFTKGQVGASSVQLSWSANEIATGYNIEYAENTTDGSDPVWQTAEIDYAGTFYILSGLNPGTNYIARISASCNFTPDSAEYNYVNFSTLCLSGGDITIGEGTSTNSYFPSYTFYNYCVTQQVYTAAELNGQNQLSGLSFQNGSTNAPTRTWKIYLKHTSSASASSWIDMAGAEMVFSGSVSINSNSVNNGWTSISFNTPFAYNGTDNLVVVFVDETGSYESSPSYKVHSISGTSRYYYQDGGLLTITSEPVASSAGTSSVRNNIIFSGQCGTSTDVCVVPNVAVTDADEESVTLSWAAGYQESSWEIEYQEEGTTTWVSEGYVSASPYTISNLPSSTKFNIRVRSVCDNENSNWVNLTAQTSQVPAQVPYFCDFEDNPGWAFENGSATNKWAVGTATNNGGTHAMYISNNNGVANAYTTSSTSVVWAYRDIEVQAGVPYQLSFDWKAQGESSSYDYFKVFYGGIANVTASNSSSTVTTPAGATALSGNMNLQSSYITATFLLPAAETDGIKRLYFVWSNDGSGGSNPPAAIDNISIATCIAPSAVVASNITTEGATISWTAGSDETEWEYVYAPAGTSVDWDVEVPTMTTATTFDLTGLNADTRYTVYVRSICGPDDYSGWISYSFRTACDMIAAVPYVENFDSYGTGTYATSYPTCWTRLNTYSSNYPYINSSYTVSAPGSVYFYSGTSGTYNLAILPQIDESALNINDLQVTFQYRPSNSTSTIVVGVMSDPTSEATFVPVQTITGTTNEWNEYTVMFDNYTGTGTYVAFKNAHNGSTSYGYLDDVVLEMIPDCPRPNSISLTGTTSSSVTLAWEATGDATAWNIVYGPTGFDPDNYENNPDVVLYPTTENPTMIDNLLNTTTYDFYVQTDCGGNVSPWRGVVTTAPGSFNMATTGQYTVYMCGGHIYDNGGPSGQYSNNCNATYIIYPETPGNVVAIQGTLQAEGSYDYLEFYDGAGTNNLIQRVVANSSTVNVGPFESTSGPLTVRFYSDGSSVYDGFDLVVSCISSSCLRPNNFTVLSTNATSVNLGWNVNGEESSWNIVYGPTGFDPDNYDNNPDVVLYPTTENPTLIENLVNTTTYDFYIQADCGSELSNWWGPLTVSPGSINMATTGEYTVYMCGGHIYDNGGPSGQYSNNCNATYIIYPETPGNVVSISGTYSGEGCCDYLYIYDGAGTSGTLLGTIVSPSSGALVNVGPYTSTTGPLTIHFTSDGSNVHNGFDLTVSCTPVSCLRPGNVTATNITSTSTDIVWMENGTATSWNVVVGAVGVDPDTETPDYVSTNTYPITGLTPSTTYSVYVQSNCDNGDVSEWSQVCTFTTGCVEISTLPYSESFDTYGTGTSAFPDCWKRSTTYSDYPYISGTYHSAPGAMYFYVSSTGQYNIAVTPRFDNTINVSDLQVTLNYYPGTSTSQIIVGVMTDATIPSTFVPVDTIGGTTSTWGEHTVSFNNYTGTGSFIAFKNQYNTSYSYGYIDDVFIEEIPSCPRPRNISSTAIDMNSATLTWEETGNATAWNIIYGESGFDMEAGEGTTIPANSNPFTLTGLTDATHYDVYVQADCGAGDVSLWSNVFDFYTDCDVVAVPYYENFDSYTGTSFNEAGPLPLCWANYTQNTTYPAPHITSTTVSTSYCYPHSGTNALTFTAGSDGSNAFAILPEFSTSLDMLQMSFYYRMESTSSGTLTLGYVTNASTPVATFTAIQVIPSITTITEYEIDFSTLTNVPTGARLAFKWDYNSSYYSCGIDDISVYDIPSCSRPTITNVVAGMTSADVTVAQGNVGTPTGYEYVVGTPGFDPDLATPVQVSSTTFNVTGLTGSTTYDLYVRTICGADGNSIWSNVYTFTTSVCEIADQCTFTINMTDGFGDSWNGCSLTIKQNGITMGTYTISDYTYTATATVTLCDGIAATMEWHNGSFPDETSFTITDANGNTVASFAEGTLGVEGPIGTFNVNCSGTTPTECDMPTNLATSNISQTGATATWSAGGTENAWNVQYKQASAANWGNSISVSTTNYNITGLTANTAYQVRVQAVCDASTTSDWTAPVSFTTLDETVETCPSPTNLTATDVQNESITLTWNQEANTANSWTVNYRTQGATAWNSATATAVPYTLTGLTGLTTYEIQVIANCTNGLTSDPSSTITATTTNVGVNEHDLDRSVSVYPNPTAGQITITAQSAMESVCIYDVYGKLISTQKVEDTNAVVEMSGYAAGVYFAKITTAEGIVTKRIVKR